VVLNKNDYKPITAMRQTLLGLLLVLISVAGTTIANDRRVEAGVEGRKVKRKTKIERVMRPGCYRTVVRDNARAMV
jgi:hypothetical protein